MRDLMLQLHGRVLEADREACFSAVARMLELSNLARMSGILALEAEAETDPDAFIRTGLELLVDGTDPETVEQVMRNLILSGDHSDTELLRRLVLAEGVVGIQQGENPRILAVRMASMLGELYLERAKSAATVDLTAYEYTRVIHERGALPESAEFEEMFRQLSRRDIQLVLRTVGDTGLITDALAGCGAEIFYKITENVSNNIRTRICRDIVSFDENAEFYLQAQQVLMNVVKELQGTGEVIFPKEYPVGEWGSLY